VVMAKWVRFVIFVFPENMGWPIRGGANAKPSGGVEIPFHRNAQAFPSIYMTGGVNLHRCGGEFE
jgi:hypothetical protein